MRADPRGHRAAGLHRRDQRVPDGLHLPAPTPQAKTLAVGLYGLIEPDRSNNLGVFAAGALITAMPVVLLFQYLQRYIVGGLTAGAVKG